MPTKLGRGGSGPEDFDPDTGEYTAGSTISRRGNKYWVHGDLRSREITKEEYDLYKSKGYKDEFPTEAKKKKYKLYKQAYGYGTTPSFYDQDGFEFEVDEQDILDILNQDLDKDTLRRKLGEAALPGESKATQSQVGLEILRDYNDEWLKIKREREAETFKPKIEAANKYLDNIGKRFENWDKIPVSEKLDYSNRDSNESNYKISRAQITNQRKYDMYTSNCQRCVAAWYLNMLGYDVEAMPYDGSDYFNQFGKAKSNYAIYKNAPRLGYEEYGVKTFRSNWSYSAFNIPSETMYDYHGKEKEHQKTQHNTIYDLVSKSPDKSVYFCSVRWRGYNSSHVFVIYNDGGKPKFIDPQDNSDASRYFNKDAGYSIVAAETSLLRVNDFSLNGDLLPEIVRKRGEGKEEHDRENQENYKSI